MLEWIKCRQREQSMTDLEFWNLSTQRLVQGSHTSFCSLETCSYVRRNLTWIETRLPCVAWEKRTSIGILGPQLVAMLGKITEPFEMVPCWGKHVTRRGLPGFRTSPCFWFPRSALCWLMKMQSLSSLLSWTLPLEPEAKINSSFHRSLLIVVFITAT